MKAAPLAISAVLLIAACSAPDERRAPLATVAAVDLGRYAGRWHEIARYPNRFQRDCARDTTADYLPLGDGRLEVHNRCQRADGSEMSVRGVAEVDPRTNAQLKVSFLPAWLRWTGIGRGDYWVLYLSPEYRVAIVGEPSRTFLWVLARTPTLGDGELEALFPLIRAAGYNPERLLRAAR